MLQQHAALKDDVLAALYGGRSVDKSNILRHRYRMVAQDS